MQRGEQGFWGQFGRTGTDRALETEAPVPELANKRRIGISPSNKPHEASGRNPTYKKDAPNYSDFIFHLILSLTDSLQKSRPSPASWMKDLMKCFPEIHIVDGSRLDAVCRGIGILRNVRARVLGGCMTVFYIMGDRLYASV